MRDPAGASAPSRSRWRLHKILFLTVLVSTLLVVLSLLNTHISGIGFSTLYKVARSYTSHQTHNVDTNSFPRTTRVFAEFERFEKTTLNSVTDDAADGADVRTPQPVPNDGPEVKTTVTQLHHEVGQCFKLAVIRFRAFFGNFAWPRVHEHVLVHFNLSGRSISERVCSLVCS